MVHAAERRRQGLGGIKVPDLSLFEIAQTLLVSGLIAAAVWIVTHASADDWEG